MDLPLPEPNALQRLEIGFSFSKSSVSLTEQSLQFENERRCKMHKAQKDNFGLSEANIDLSSSTESLPQNINADSSLISAISPLNVSPSKLFHETVLSDIQ